MFSIFDRRIDFQRLYSRCKSLNRFTAKLFLYTTHSATKPKRKMSNICSRTDKLDFGRVCGFSDFYFTRVPSND